MNEKLTPIELSELFIHGFSQMSRKLRKETNRRLKVGKTENPDELWKFKFVNEFKKFVFTALADSSCYVFFKKELSHQSVIYLFKSLFGHSDYWYLVEESCGALKGDLYFYDQIWKAGGKINEMHRRASHA